MLFSDRVSHALGRAALNFAELRHGFVDDWGNLRHLFLGQAKVDAQMPAHPFTENPRLRM